MAQWAGQFSGRTHATKVSDAEAKLKAAIKSASGAVGEDRQRLIAAVRRLAGDLLSARVKAIKARIAYLSDVPKEEAMSERSHEISSGQTRLDRLKAEGADGILREYGALEALHDTDEQLPCMKKGSPTRRYRQPR